MPYATPRRSSRPSSRRSSLLSRPAVSSFLALLGLATLAPLAFAACGGKSSDEAETGPGSGAAGSGGGGGSAGNAGNAGNAGAPGSGKVDLLFMVDDSASMADKQRVLAMTVPDILARFANPRCVDTSGAVVASPASPADACPVGSKREVTPVRDMHVGVITSSLGGHGADLCEFNPGQSVTGTNNPTKNGHGQLVARDDKGGVVATTGGKGFLAWDPEQKEGGETDFATLVQKTASIVVGAGQIGCGYEAQLESWYRFLVDPRPPQSVLGAKKANGGPDITQAAAVTGVDQTVLAQRKAFLRSDSTLVIVMLTDENDCSIIDGQLPPKVCDTPKLDAQGTPTGCAAAATDAPEDWQRGNFHNGMPFPSNYVAALQYGDPNVAFRMKTATSACADDPASPACTTCFWADSSSDPACSKSGGNMPAEDDSVTLRCWDQKRRFGLDTLYPLSRYVDGLTKAKIYDRDGYLVDNPIFAGGRKPEDVILAGIVGVPWQDLARDPKDLTKGYKPAAGDGAFDWDIPLGDPFNPDKTKRHAPADPLMSENNVARGGTHPVTGEAIGGAGWNSINGTEWNSKKEDLQFACVFPLPAPVDCKAQPCSDCKAPDAMGTVSNKDSKNPLCSPPADPADPAKGGQPGIVDPVQYRAKAYPATRALSVMQKLGGRAVPTSICSPNTTDPSRADYGYRQSAAAIFAQVAPRLPK